MSLPDVYIAALNVTEIFADPTYQRTLDVARARRYAAEWDRRLAGILEVSDRGENAYPRFAILDGQHRWAAARFLANPPALVANVHTGLTIEDEAALFDKLNRQRKQTNTWDHWKARRAAGDETVRDIEIVVERHHLVVDMSPNDGRVACVSALEKVVALGGTTLLDSTLELITKAWGDRRDAFDASIIRGVALVVHHLGHIVDGNRLFAALHDVTPRQVKAQANAVREITPGTAPVATAIALMSFYNKQPGRRIEVSNKTFGGSGVRNNAPKPVGAPKSERTARRKRSTADNGGLEKIALSTPQIRNVPESVAVSCTYTDDQLAAVESMDDAGLSVPEIAGRLGVSERTVRRIRADLGLEAS